MALTSSTEEGYSGEEDSAEFLAGQGLESFTEQVQHTLQDVKELLHSLYEHREDAEKLAGIIGSAMFQSVIYHTHSAIERGKLENETK